MVINKIQEYDMYIELEQGLPLYKYKEYTTQKAILNEKGLSSENFDEQLKQLCDRLGI